MLRLGQEFTTGSNEDGYTLTGVDIVSASSTGFRAQLCNELSSSATCTALTAPDSFAVGAMSFTAPAGTTLTKDTTYAVVLTTDNTNGPGFYTHGWGVTDADAEDTGSAAGWSIADGYRPITNNHTLAAWASDRSAPTLRIAITGTAVDRTIDATLSRLVVSDGSADLTLTPTFAFGNSTATQGITSLQAGDFAGLTSLIVINLSANSLTSLPGTVFSGLTALTTLSLNENVLDSLPADVFSGLTSLNSLQLNGGALSSLDGEVFTGLSLDQAQAFATDAVHRLTSVEIQFSVDVALFSQ